MGYANDSTLISVVQSPGVVAVLTPMPSLVVRVTSVGFVGGVNFGS